jgi:hypothetical protein
MCVIPWVEQEELKNITEYFIPNSDYIYLSIVPVVTYLNGDTDKLSIIKENKGKSGVYK